MDDKGWGYIALNSIGAGAGVGETPAAPAAPDDFTDVAVTSPYRDAIDWAVKQNIAAGYSNRTFRPGNACTVSHILTFLWRANGKPGAAEGVADRDAAWNWAMENQLVSATSVMNPTADPCTRAMAVTFMWKAAGSPSAKSASSFTDVAADADYAAVSWAVEKGITNGTGENRFSPDRTCTRGQIVTFLYRSSK